MMILVNDDYSVPHSTNLIYLFQFLVHLSGGLSLAASCHVPHSSDAVPHAGMGFGVHNP